MERRDFIRTGLAGAAVGLMSAAAANAQDQSHDHQGKQQAAMPVMNDALKKVVNTAFDCVKTGTACVAECNRALAKGESAMAECQQAVLSMLPVCEATASNASMQLAGDELLRKLIEVCAEFSEHCASACEAHAGHYVECKNCMNSCNECADACKAYLKT